MSTAFREKLQDFIRRQRNQSENDAQHNAHQFSQEVQEYAPKERWGNIFKYIVAYALGIGLGHALAAALIRGADELAKPSGMDPDALANAIESGDINADNFEAFMDNEIGISDPDFGELEAAMSGFEDPTTPDVAPSSESCVAQDVGQETDVGDAAGDLGDTLGGFLES